MTLEKLCVRIESFNTGMKRRDIYILLFKYLAMMLMLGVFLCVAITSVTEMLAMLISGIVVVFGLTVVVLISITESEELFGTFRNYMKLWWVVLIVEAVLTVVVKLFV